MVIKFELRIYAIIIFSFTSLLGFSQKDSSVGKHESVMPKAVAVGKDSKETRETNNNQNNIAVPTALSKSERTSQPTLIKIKRGELKNVVTIHSLIQDIPATCIISTCQITYKILENVYFLNNVGAELDQSLTQKLEACSWVIIENIKSSCPKSHKANYKINFQ